MTSSFRIPRKLRLIFSRLGSLLLLFQKTPFVQMLLPETRIMGTTGIVDLVKWTAVSVAGLGAYDTVAGATVMAQIAPKPVVTPVPAIAGTAISMTLQVTGAPGNPGSWQVIGTLPSGITKTNAGSTCTLSGVPTVAGNFPFTIKAWEHSGNSGGSISKAFAINVAAVAPAITSHPLSKSIVSGATASLTVAASGTSPTFQWYRGSSGNTSNPVSGATSTTFTTPALTADATYWASATNTAGSANSTTATITVGIPPAITTQPVSNSVTNGGTAILTVIASGTSPTFQWYLGKSGNTSSLISGATGTSYQTPPITTESSFWVRASNFAGHADSSEAVVSLLDSYTAWRNSQFASAQLADPLISGNTADPDVDGITNVREFILGLPPLSPLQPSSPAFSNNAGQLILSFSAKAAAGPGYQGMTRHYALESAKAPGEPWSPISGYSDIIANDQVVNYPITAVGSSGFYHLKIWLTP